MDTPGHIHALLPSETELKRVKKPLIFPLCASNRREHGCIPMREILESQARKYTEKVKKLPEMSSVLH